MSNFIKQTVASLFGTLLGLFIFCGVGTVGFFLLLAAIAASSYSSSAVKDKSVLVVDLSTNITDSEPNSQEVLQRVLSSQENQSISLRTVLDALEKAKRDKRIVGIYLDASQTSATNSAGFATLKEVRQALEQFRAAGKKVVAYGTNWEERQYYLGSVADTVVLNPFGIMELNGFSAQPLFFAGALQKYGIGVQVVRVGKFKGGVEPYVLTKLSPENRQQTEKLLGDIWAEWRNATGTSRQISPKQLQVIANNQVLLEANQAKANRLVDRVAYFDEVVADLKQLTGSNKEDKTFRQISLRDYAQVALKRPGGERHSKNKIAVVYAEGDIVDGQGENAQVGGDRFAQIFRRLRQDRDVKAVVFRINSRGGSATGSEVIQREVRLTQQVKPVVVSMGDFAASGGYWIATDSTRIFAEPSTITGSIGVFGLLINAQKLANDHGITWDTVKTGRYADLETSTRPKSPQELALYQRSVDRVYSQFLSKVAQGRKLSQQKVAEIAQGRVWSGATAKRIGLVDEIGGLNAAIKYAVKLTNLGNDWQLQEYPRVSNFGELLFGEMTEEVRTILGIEQAQPIALTPLMAEFQKLQDEIIILQKLNDPQGVYARLPFNFQLE